MKNFCSHGMESPIFARRWDSRNTDGPIAMPFSGESYSDVIILAIPGWIMMPTELIEAQKTFHT